MGIKGSFSLGPVQRLGGEIRMWQFTLQNTNMMFSETVDVMLCDCYGQSPFYFRNVKLKAGQSVVFNLDTVDWTWYQDDFAAIIDSNNRIITKWKFHIPEYRPGECPDCHGTKKCRYCRGQGRIYPPGRIWEARICTHCGGTGMCHTCDIPRRKPQMGMGPTGLKPF